MLSQATRISTDDVPPSQRLAYWEAYNAAALVGLRCSTFAPTGLHAQQANVDLGGMRVAHIAGNQHAVERNPEMVRTFPKDSTFVSLILRGEAFFYHGGGCLTLSRGDVILYDTERPYLFGFSGMMRKVLLDVPTTEFREWCLPRGLVEPIKFAGNDHENGLLVRALQRAAAVCGGEEHEPAAARERVWALVNAMVQREVGSRAPSSVSAAHVAIAEAYIERHLSEPALTPARVAAAVGLSLRHLNRLFAETGGSVGAFLLDRRLARARAELGAPARAAETVTEIAFDCGFVSQPHFTRAFKCRYGCTPGELRQYYASPGVPQQ